jgi:hypothetical protein
MNENQKKVSDDYRTNWDSIFSGTKHCESIPFAGNVEYEDDSEFSLLIDALQESLGKAEPHFVIHGKIEKAIAMLKRLKELTWNQ